MPLEQYITAFLAGFLGGELLILPMIIALKINHLNLISPILFAAAGTLSRDWITFLVFRFFGRKLLTKRPRLNEKLKIVDEFVSHNPPKLMVFYRIMIGFVSLLVITMGLSQIPIKKFIILSLIANSIFILVISGGGYFFGQIMLDNILWIKEHWWIGLIALIALTSFYFFLKRGWLEYFKKS